MIGWTSEPDNMGIPKMFKLAKTPESVVTEMNLFTARSYHEDAWAEVYENAQHYVGYC
jgi:hypothetical protein